MMWGACPVLRDPPGGGVRGLYRRGRPTRGRGAAHGFGEFSWHELATSDYEAGFDFYSALFGWTKTTAMDMGEMGMYQMYGSGEQELGGMYNLTPEIPAPPHWLLYTTVSDVAVAAETVKSLGGKVLNGPMDVPDGDRVVQCMDPQGAAFALHSRAGGAG